jgi:hypothetical protein
MTVASLIRAWNGFFFTPQRPTPVALYRIIYGVLNIANLFLLRPDWLAWYGPHAVVSAETVRHLTRGMRIDVLMTLPQTDFAANGVFWVFLLFAVLLTIGFMTRTSAVIVYVLLSSIQNRNIYILNSGDTLLRVTGFFLMFAPAGAAFSVDRLLRIWRGREGTELPLSIPWAQRMIQLQTALVYFCTFWWKTLGYAWFNGTAVYYALSNREIQRFPVPGLHNLVILKLATWGTLVIEFAMGVLVWLRDLRYYILLAALLLHASIEYSVNIPMFEWITAGTYVTFIYPEDLTRWWTRLRARVAPRMGAARMVLYDAAYAPSRYAANLLRALDVFQRLRLIDVHAPDAPAISAEGDAIGPRARVLVATPEGLRAGFAALCALAPVVPLLWPLTPLTLVSWPAKRISGAATPAR